MCDGKRYNEDTLAITYNGKHAAAILDMTISEAVEFFAGVTSIKRPFRFSMPLAGYLTLDSRATPCQAAKRNASNWRMS